MSDLGEMHPPGLKMMETNNGTCSRGESSCGKGKEIGNNSIEGKVL